MKKFWEKYERPIILTGFAVAGSIGYYFGGVVGILIGFVSIPIAALGILIAGIPILSMLTLICACIAWALGEDNAFEEF